MSWRALSLWTSRCVTTCETSTASARRSCAEPREARVLDLRAEVRRVEAGVALEAVVAREPLHVHDRVDADRVRVRAGARPEHHDPPPDLAERVLVQLVEALLADDDLGDLDRP